MMHALSIFQYFQYSKAIMVIPVADPKIDSQNFCLFGTTDLSYNVEASGSMLSWKIVVFQLVHLAEYFGPNMTVL